MEAAIQQDIRPKPDYGAFLKRTGARMISLSDVGASHNEFFNSLVASRAIEWAFIPLVFDDSRAQDIVIAGNESFGVALALDAAVRSDNTTLWVRTTGRLLQDTLLVSRLRETANAHFFCSSALLREVILHRSGFSPERVVATGHYVDSQFFRPSPCESDTRKVVAFCAGDRAVDTVLSATAELDVSLTVVSPKLGRNETYSPKKARRPGRPRLAVAYCSDPLTLRTLLNPAQVVICVSSTSDESIEHRGVAEAMSMGKTVIESQSEWRTGLIEHSRNGICVEPDSSGALRSAICDLLSNPAARLRIGITARNDAARLYSGELYSWRMEQAIGFSRTCSASEASGVEHQYM